MAHGFVNTDDCSLGAEEKEQWWKAAIEQVQWKLFQKKWMEKSKSQLNTYLVGVNKLPISIYKYVIKTSP
jgi:hypothetical protein